MSPPRRLGIGEASPWSSHPPPSSISSLKIREPVKWSQGQYRHCQRGYSRGAWAHSGTAYYLDGPWRAHRYFGNVLWIPVHQRTTRTYATARQNSTTHHYEKKRL